MVPGVLALVATSCSGSASHRACGGVETLFEARFGHVRAGVSVSYRWHPPTSGLHVEQVPRPGVHDQPVAEPEQVAALEAGMVVIQERRPSPADQARLAALAEADGRVLVVPAGRIDDGRRVALTAWGHRQRCDRLSVPDARAFVSRFAGHGPG